MREKLHLDVYNVIIIALIPFVLLVAWGLTWGYERNLHERQCKEAVTYLEEAADFSSLYTNAGSLDDADPWLDEMQEMSYPAPLADLHNGAVAAFTYAATTSLPVEMNQPAGLYERLTTFKEVLDDGRDKIVRQCPEVDPLIPNAFPMYFREAGE